jgi:hypothetical protein
MLLKIIKVFFIYNLIISLTHNLLDEDISFIAALEPEKFKTLSNKFRNILFFLVCVGMERLFNQNKINSILKKY